MNDTKKISVVKVPNEHVSEKVEQMKNSLPRMPRMYLELLENKEKVKPQMINRDYDPSDAESVISSMEPTSQKEVTVKIPDTISEKSIQDSDSDNDDISISESEASNGTSIHDASESIGSVDDKVDVESNYSSVESDDALSEKNETRNKIRQMLEEEEVRPVSSAPKLSDLERDGMVRPSRNIANMDYLDDTLQQDEEDQKREMLFKFEILKKSYKDANIPEFSVHSSLKQMNEVYENQLRHLSLDSSVQNYTNILVGGFMIFEFIFGVWLKFDMSGFTQQQILNMSQYNRLLIELGQKSYVPEGEQWPVEFRLIGLIVLNAVIFIISKMILKRTGNNLMDMMNHARNPAPAREAPKKKMRPPTVDFDDL